MEFLGIDKKAISNFQLLLLQTEVGQGFIFLVFTSASLHFFSTFILCSNPFSIKDGHKYPHFKNQSLLTLIVVESFAYIFDFFVDTDSRLARRSSEWKLSPSQIARSC